MNQNRQTLKRADKKESNRETLEALFDNPPPRETPMAAKLDEIQQQIEALQRQKIELLNKERSAAIADINAKIKTFNLKAKDLDFGGSKTGEVKNPVPPKYQKGNELWSGRGRKPRWVEDHLAAGGKLEQLLIKK